jgi:pSer/pThr/pTyr-binding forkhead associated (FHA) protein
MPPPRKNGQGTGTGVPVSRGTGEIENDPEREQGTQARVNNPLPADPEQHQPTQARAANPLVDPEVENKTQARAAPPPPPPKRRRPPTPIDDPGADYHTGQSYAVADQSEDLSGSVSSASLDGDGLDPVEPDELAPRTRVLPAPQPEPEDRGGDDDEGADDANATHAGPPLKLEIIAGPDSGKTKKFRGVRMIIGRTPGVDLQLTDQSVSRRHVELVQADGGVLMRDLGSGNGTRLNGLKVAEKILEHGDEIHIGKTKLRFVDEVSAFKKIRDEAEKREAEKKAPKKAPTKQVEKPADAEPSPDADPEAPAARADEGANEEDEPEATAADPAPRRGTRDRSRPVRGGRGRGDEGGAMARFQALPKAVRLGLVGFVAIVFLFVVLGVVLKPPPPPPVDTHKADADARMQLARTAAREGRYEDTVKLVEEADKIFPGIDKTHLGSQAREELSAKAALDEVRKLLADKRFEDAKKALEPAARSSVRYADDKKALEVELARAELDYKKEKAREFLGAGELDAAKNILGELPIDQQAELAQEIANFERELDEQHKKDQQQARVAAVNAAGAAKARREQEITIAFAVVERKFAGADWDRAASECARVVDNAGTDQEIISRANLLKSLIPNFGRNYEEGVRKFKSGQVANASKPLRAAYQLFNQMGLRANAFGRELEDKLAQASVAAGKEALVREDLMGAAVNFRDAVKLDPNDSRARQGLDEVVARADDLYQTAYIIKDRDPREALKKFKVVVEVTPPGSATHEKAKNQVAGMAQ